MKGYDYSQNGVYFVTVCAYRSAKLFGAIDDDRMMPNAIGRIIVEEWQRTAELRPNVGLDAFVVMPNHIHGIVIVHNQDSQTTEHVAHAVEAKSASSLLKAGSLGAIVGRFKGKVTRRVRELPKCRELVVWQRNYHDHIIRNEKSLQAIREYIATNPARWIEDSYCID